MPALTWKLLIAGMLMSLLSACGDGRLTIAAEVTPSPTPLARTELAPAVDVPKTEIPAVEPLAALPTAQPTPILVPVPVKPAVVAEQKPESWQKLCVGTYEGQVPPTSLGGIWGHKVKIEATFILEMRNGHGPYQRNISTSLTSVDQGTPATIYTWSKFGHLDNPLNAPGYEFSSYDDGMVWKFQFGGPARSMTLEPAICRDDATMPFEPLVSAPVDTRVQF